MRLPLSRAAFLSSLLACVLPLAAEDDAASAPAASSTTTNAAADDVADETRDLAATPADDNAASEGERHLLGSGTDREEKGGDRTAAATVATGDDADYPSRSGGGEAAARRTAAAAEALHDDSLSSVPPLPVELMDVDLSEAAALTTGDEGGRSDGGVASVSSSPLSPDPSDSSTGAGSSVVTLDSDAGSVETDGDEGRGEGGDDAVEDGAPLVEEPVTLVVEEVEPLAEDEDSGIIEEEGLEAVGTAIDGGADAGTESAHVANSRNSTPVDSVLGDTGKDESKVPSHGDEGEGALEGEEAVSAARTSDTSSMDENDNSVSRASSPETSLASVTGNSGPKQTVEGGESDATASSTAERDGGEQTQQGAEKVSAEESGAENFISKGTNEAGEVGDNSASDEDLHGDSTVHQIHPAGDEAADEANTKEGGDHPGESLKADVKDGTHSSAPPRKPQGSAESEECGPSAQEDDNDAVSIESENKIEDDDSDDDDGPTERLIVDYANKNSGAIILEKSPSMKGTSNLLKSDNDQYAIAPCEDRKFVVVGLSEDILVKQIKLSNYERYSSHPREFQVLGSQTNTGSDWADLGTFSAEPGNGEQAFDLEEPAWARYLKFRFLTHYGAEHYCTVTQIKVHGSTMTQGFHEQWIGEQEGEEDGNVDENGDFGEEGTDRSEEGMDGGQDGSASADSDRSAGTQIDSAEEGSSLGTSADTPGDREPIGDANVIEGKDVMVDSSDEASFGSTEEREDISQQDVSSSSRGNAAGDRINAAHVSAQTHDASREKEQRATEPFKDDSTDSNESEITLPIDNEGTEETQAPTSGEQSRHAAETDFSDEASLVDTSVKKERKGLVENSSLKCASMDPSKMGKEGDALSCASIGTTSSSKTSSTIRQQAAPEAAYVKAAGGGIDISAAVKAAVADASDAIMTGREKASESVSGAVKEIHKMISEKMSNVNVSVSRATSGEDGSGKGSYHEFEVSGQGVVSDMNFRPSQKHDGDKKESETGQPKPGDDSQPNSRDAAVGGSSETGQKASEGSPPNSKGTAPISTDSKADRSVPETSREEGDAIRTSQLDRQKPDVDGAPVVESLGEDSTAKKHSVSQDGPISEKEFSARGPSQRASFSTADANVFAALSQRFPSASCLEGLGDPQGFRAAKVAAGRAGAAKAAKAADKAGGGPMQPIFKTLSDEIKALQYGQSAYDQYMKAMSSCYQQIILDMARELKSVEDNQALRLLLLEDAIRSIQAERGENPYLTHVLSIMNTIWGGLCSIGLFLLAVAQDEQTKGMVRIIVTKITSLESDDWYAVACGGIVLFFGIVLLSLLKKWRQIQSQFPRQTKKENVEQLPGERES